MINFDMLDIWQAVQDGSTFTMKQNVLFQVGICLEKFQLDQIQNYGRLGHYWHYYL